MCLVGKVVNENISLLNGLLATEGAPKAQFVSFVIFSNLYCD